MTATLRFHLARRAVVACVLLGAIPLGAGRADITNWQTGETIPGTEGITPRPGMYLVHWNTDSHNLRYADFSDGLDLHRSSLWHSWLDFALFTQANLTDARLLGAKLTNADLSQANLTGAELGSATLTGADLSQANLTNAGLRSSTLANADLSQANLTNAWLSDSTLTGADLTDAFVVGADVSDTTSRGFTKEQLYSTASYKNRDLAGVGLQINDLTGWNFAGQNLTCARFGRSTLTNANLTDAIVMGVWFEDTTSRGFTQEQLYSTASYKNRDLAGINLGGNDLTGWNFDGQNLTNASFWGATLTDADLADAMVVGASFVLSPLETSGGLTKEQLYSTASYQNHDLSGIGLGGIDLTGWNFARQNLTGARFGGDVDGQWAGARLSDTDLTDAIVVGAWFAGTTSRGFTQEQLYSTASHRNRDLSGISLRGNDLTGWNFDGQNLTAANFFESTLAGVSLRQANLSGADLVGSTLSGADLTDAIVAGAYFELTTYLGFTKEQLYSTASYRDRELAGIGLGSNDLTGWNFAGQNLTGASLGGSTLTDADLTGAIVVGAYLTASSFTQEQLYSTASYQNRDLSGIDLSSNDLTGWNFASQNLTGAKFGVDAHGWGYHRSTLNDADLSHANLTGAEFYGATLEGADLTGADTRGAIVWWLGGATLTNTILPDGHVSGLDLSAEKTLVVRDYDGDPDPTSWAPPILIRVEDRFLMGSGGVLQLLFEADAWDSTISFDAGIPVMLGGTLDLDFAPGVDLASQVGRTFQVFDWTGVEPIGEFAIASPYQWDVSRLYTAGQVTFIGIPEPSCLVLALVGISSMVFRQRRQ